jgi:hypothetical protein
MVTSLEIPFRAPADGYIRRIVPIAYQGKFGKAVSDRR